MKLELKHIIPYLPYGLKAEMLDYKNDYVGKQFDEIIGVHQWSKNNDWCLLTDGGSKPAFDRIKPILHPISDLKDNKDFIRKFGGDNPNNLRMCNLDIDDLINNGLEFETYYGYYEWLIENHFDVFGLIENNLAIDINTLKN